MRDFLVSRLGPLGADGVARQLASGGFVDAEGHAWAGSEAYRPNAFVWFHRELRDEPEVPFQEEILYADERIVVADKPHFLSTIPRGRHVVQSLVVRLRNRLDLLELGPAHRLDRLTAGVVLLTTEARWRGAYQSLFEDRAVTKTYRAIAPYDERLQLPRRLGGHIVKHRGSLQAKLVPGEPDNAETWLELVERRGDWAEYRLTPRTGRTHQLRVQLNALGLPILGDPLYPRVLDVSVDDFTVPLRLLAESLEFVDPIDGCVRRFASHRQLDWPE
ncbi:pseudouridine synthase [Ammonicoccus fulvus]|uniref:RNA pseudouridylate synthase n=1 Tax=Ammonicoccus fulvus TaxID=3138240 RepID=A0ABZ3FTE3_9ACTN